MWKDGIQNFKASSGWFTRFIEKHGIRFKNIYGVSTSNNMEMTNEWFHGLSVLTENYEPEAFNGLFSSVY